MAFQMRVDESVAKDVKRVVRRQIDKALERIHQDGSDDEAVHDARKRLKQIRAVLRLVRDELGDKAYRRENTGFRDAGRPLTEVRDAKALLDALDQLHDRAAGQVAADIFDAVRRALKANRKAVRHRVLEEEKAFTQVMEGITAARDRIPDWRIRHKGWPALGRGLKRVYRNGARALATAAADATVENLHEWRKQAKYLWHILQLLEPVWPRIMEELAKRAHELTQYLGDDHDLAVLRQTILADSDAFGGADRLKPLLALIDRRREELQREAFLAGRRLYREKPRDFTDRIKTFLIRGENERVGLDS